MNFVEYPPRVSYKGIYEPCKIDDTGVGEDSLAIYERCQECIGHYDLPLSRLLQNPVRRFYAYKELWEEETALYSSITEIVMHPAYQKIIGLGEHALPLILQELETNPGHWFWALKSITDEDPVLPEDRGRVTKMAEAWLKWGRQKGFCK